jgi:16S rRNA (uracil1498-N3)-methyltransferase
MSLKKGNGVALPLGKRTGVRIMARFYVPQPRIQNGMLKIEGDEVKHIRKVLRLRAGDEIVVFDGLGKELKGTIVKEGLSSVVIRIQNIFSTKRDSPLEVTLAQSLLKGEKMDYLIQKATELGVKEIIPFFSSRSVPLLEKSRRLKRHHRWERIGVEASKQCGRGSVPKIGPLQNYSDMLQVASKEDLRLILWERGGIGLKEILERSKERRKVFFIIGPEGGFNQQEIDEAKRVGFTPVALGRRILRAETASLCFLSILQYERGDIG